MEATINEELNFDKVLELSGTGQGTISHTASKAYLRHTHPMLGVDWIADRDFETGWIHAVRAVSCSDPVFAGHFPDAAVYPGTSINQDVNQVGIMLLIGMTTPLQEDGNSQEITAVKSITSSFGHPVPPGCLLDIAVWATAKNGQKTLDMQFESRVREFPFYNEPNKFGLTFGPAIKGNLTLVRAKRRIYDGIWL